MCLVMSSDSCPIQNFWLDMRSHMDPAPSAVNEACSIRRTYT